MFIFTFFAEGKALSMVFLNQEQKKGGSQCSFFQQSGRNEHCLRMGNCKNLEVNIVLSYFLPEVWSKKQSWRIKKAHRVGFQN